ncbi:MAG: orotidine-5'-phosphate decarboxylase [Niastella sp.]|nr:orotidine-5'-phosphate decarboxylase [Niastella sp.]
MHRNILVEQIRTKKSYLCVGLDTDIDKIPAHLQQQPNAIVKFNKAIIDATLPYCVSYKLNTAFYEALGSKGWDAMEETLAYIPKTHFKIADAKRADIGNTSNQYAKAFFETLDFDAITLAPYMGEDSIRPFLEYENKWAIVLALTSNKGAADFEMLGLRNGDENSHLRAEFLYERVLKKVSAWGNPNNLMFVVGATQATEFKNIREIVPDHFLLVPGVGFQGGSLQNISKNAMNSEVGLLVNVSRTIIFAGDKENFAEEAALIARQYQAEMERYI